MNKALLFSNCSILLVLLSAAGMPAMAEVYRCGGSGGVAPEYINNPKDAQTRGCKAMQGILAEGSDLLADAENIPESVLDAAIIGMAQKVEHYEIAAYGTVIAYSRLMGHDAVTEMLRGILEQEEGADNALSGLAEKEINAMAMA